MSTCTALVVISLYKECGRPCPDGKEFCLEHLVKDKRNRAFFSRGIPTRADPHGKTMKMVPRG